MNLESLDLLFEGRNSFIYYQDTDQFETPVVVKVLKAEYPSTEQIVQFNNEYELTRDLAIPGLRKAYASHKIAGKYALFLEYFDGQPASQIFGSGTRSLGEFLRVAIAITTALDEVHQRNIIHKDLNSSNILVDRETLAIKIIDFGISTRVERKASHLGHPTALEGTLAYISPEQTGRMNRVVDYASDFYSLGVTFYELLTGRLPFESDDPMELVHCHIARQPTPVREIADHVPGALSNIVRRLMAKNAEDRYLSAYGLRRDLQQCLHQLGDSDPPDIAPFELGQHDVSSRFHIVPRLYGREIEVARLIGAFDRIAGGGRVELTLVAGYSGVGKSSLVHAVHARIAEKRGLFVSGKCNQFQRNVPYSALIQALKQLTDHLLTESADDLAQWKADILDAVGVNGQVLIDVIPTLELIIGAQPPVVELKVTEAQNRFHYVFRRFVQSICRADRPVVLFMDDLQWADSALLNLLQRLVTDDDHRHLLIVGAYRDNEVDTSHPLVTTIDKARRADAVINEITVANLTLANVASLVSDTLQCTADRAAGLAALIHEKTLGNAFFVNQFLRSLHAENSLAFDFDARSWTWDVADIQARNITDNVVELMADKIRKLPAESQKILKLAACIGDRFDLGALSIIDGRKQSELLDHLWIAIRERLIVPLDDNYRLVRANEARQADDAGETAFKFLHDRVEQACYSIIPPEQRERLHLTIGRQLLHDVEDVANHAQLFDIVNQLNQAARLIDDLDERLSLARLNLLAGKRAKQSTAYKPAQTYLAMGTSILPDDAWEHHYELTRDLHQHRIEAEYLTGDFDRSRELSDVMLSRVRTDVEKAEIYNRLVLQRTMEADYEGALTAMGMGLELLTGFPGRDDLKPAIGKQVGEINAAIGDRPIASLFTDGEMTEPAHILSMELLANGNSMAYQVDKNLLAWVGVRMINLSLRHGRAVHTGVGCGIYGTLLAAVWGKYEAGYEFGRLGMRCAEAAGPSQMCAVWYMVGSNMIPWREPIRAVYPIYDRGHQAGLDAGEWPYVGYILVYKLILQYHQGEPLTAVSDDAARSLHFVRKSQHQVATDCIEGLGHLLDNLLGVTEDRESFDLADRDEAAFLSDKFERKNFYSLCPYFIIKSQIMHLYGDYEAGLRCIEEAKKHVAFITGKLPNAYLNFHHSLNLVAACDDASDEQRAEYLAQVEQNQAQMKIWADNCEATFRHKYLLIDAERARLRGDDAMELYDRAIELAGEHEFLHEEAIANELASRYWLGKGKQPFAHIYLKRACYLFGLWGAARKVEQLHEVYGRLAVDSAGSSTLTGTGSMGTGGTTNTLLDISSIMKAAQTLSQEVQLARLLDKMLRIASENAGADRAALVQQVDGRLAVRATRDERAGESTTHGQVAVEDSDLPATIINYVARTGEPLVLNDVLSDSVYGRDPYIAASQPRSVLCFPVLSQGELRCILYLENRLGSDTFTQERLDVLNLLSSQIAISLENADLYNHLEEKVKQRTEQLERAHKTIVAFEKQAVEQQMAGGFAHEMRNAISAADVVLASVFPDGVSLATLAHQRLDQLVDAIAGELSPASRALLDDHVQRVKRDAGKLDRALHIASSSTTRALDVTRQILEYSQLGHSEPGADTTSLKAVIDGVIQEMAHDLAEHAIAVAFDCATEARVIAHESHVYSIFRNVVDNARDALIELADERARTIEIAIAAGDDEFEIAIRDNGRGIAEPDRAQIFEPFFTTKPSTGTGLGLSFVSKLLSLYRGAIDIDSEVGAGTTCRIRFPRAPTGA